MRDSDFHILRAWWLCTSMKIMHNNSLRAKLPVMSLMTLEDDACWTRNLFFWGGQILVGVPLGVMSDILLKSFDRTSSLILYLLYYSSSVTSLVSMCNIWLSLSVNRFAIISIIIAINWTWLLNLAWSPQPCPWCVVTTCSLWRFQRGLK